jgi:type I restriction enzyme R subunit
VIRIRWKHTEASPISPSRPEEAARQDIDTALAAAGWVVQDMADLNLSAGQGVAAREFPMAKGHGRADYLLFVDGRAVGALEAKKAGYTLTGVEEQALKYGEGLPPELEAPIRPLPFLYLSTGVETRFSNRLDPEPRSRRVFTIHRPETLAEWLRADTLADWSRGWATSGAPSLADHPAQGYRALPSTLRSRLRAFPPATIPGLWSNQQRAIAALERSMAEDRPRALIQMATGSGKSLTSVASIYRLIKFGGARRVLFLVDRANLGKQAETEFANYRTYDDHRKFPELYKVQRLTGNKIGSSSKVVITTIQRLYSMLSGQPDLDPTLEELSGFEASAAGQPVAEVGYNAGLPPEYFDVIFIDEAHRSIYTLWRQVLEYFDAFLVGLTATPAKHTFGFFNQNLVMEYGREQAVADGVNVDYDVYNIRTKITAQGAKIEASPGAVVAKRERRTRKLRWEAPDEDIAYTANQLDRDVVAVDQIRLIVRTFRDRLFTEIFPGRKIVPKTLIFAKDDSHAEDITQIVREEFGKGDDFCRKITYKTTIGTPEELISDFRNRYDPRIAVTVDMIATGTDVRPIEIVMFMRSVKSRVLYEQMKGRGGRVVSKDELLSVTPDARGKDHFVLIDCVGVTESKMDDTRPLEKEPGVSFEKLLQHVAAGGANAEMVSSLASRLTRLERKLEPAQREVLKEASGGVGLIAITHGLVEALDDDRQVEKAREVYGLAPDAEPTDAQVAKVASDLIREACKPLATNPKLRKTLQELKAMVDQIIDEISRDELLSAGAAEGGAERAKALVTSFESYIAEHKDEIEALQFFYSQPYSRRLKYDDIRALATAIGAPPRSWTPERLWQAYQQLDKSRVRGAGSERLLTDIVSLVRFALHQAPELVPYADQVRARFENWLAQQGTAGRKFSPEQVRWLTMMRDHVAGSLEIEMNDFDLTPFVEEGGLGKAAGLFGKDLAGIVKELNEVLAA